MDRALIGIVSGGVVVMGLTVWLAWPEGPPPLKPEERRFMHCPKCRKDMRYDPVKADEGCPACGRDRELVVTKEKMGKAPPVPSPYPRLLVPLLVEANVLLVVGILYVRGRRKKVGEVEERFFHTNCERCHQRLRYRQASAGRAGKCPRCRRAVLFPVPPPDEDGESAAGGRLGRWWRGLKGKWHRPKEEVTGTEEP